MDHQNRDDRPDDGGENVGRFESRDAAKEIAFQTYGRFPLKKMVGERLSQDEPADRKKEWNASSPVGDREPVEIVLCAGVRSNSCLDRNVVQDDGDDGDESQPIDFGNVERCRFSQAELKLMRNTMVAVPSVH